MASLLKQYSRELVAELTKIPIVLPGESVRVGDVIAFREGRAGLFGRRVVPWGSFVKITDMEKLGVPLTEDEPSPDRNTYVYASRRSTSIGMGAAANVEAGVGGSIKIDFKAEGALYFAAVDCIQRRARDLRPLASGAASLRSALAWDDVFIVVGVTTAARALIMQSASSTASLSVSGDVNGLVPGASMLLNAGATLAVQAMNDAAFLKPWSENVNVFFDLVRFQPGERRPTVEVQGLADGPGTTEPVALVDSAFAAPAGGTAITHVSPFDVPSLDDL